MVWYDSLQTIVYQELDIYIKSRKILQKEIKDLVNQKSYAKKSKRSYLVNMSASQNYNSHASTMRISKGFLSSGESNNKPGRRAGTGGVGSLALLPGRYKMSCCTPQH